MSYQGNECDIVTKYRILTQCGGLANRDIRTLTGCGPDTASKIIQKIHIQIAKTGKLPTPKLVSVKSFIAYMNWDFDEIQKLALTEIKAVSILPQNENFRLAQKG